VLVRRYVMKIIERGDIAHCSQPRHWMEASSQFHDTAALYLKKSHPVYPLDRRLGGPQSQSGRCEEGKILSCRKLKPVPNPYSD
jgi:hypothetical protein